MSFTMRSTVFRVPAVLPRTLLLAASLDFSSAERIVTTSVPDLGGKGGPSQPAAMIAQGGGLSLQDPFADLQDDFDELPELGVSEDVLDELRSPRAVKPLSATVKAGPEQVADAREEQNHWFQWIRSSRVAKSGLLALTLALLCGAVAQTSRQLEGVQGHAREEEEQQQQLPWQEYGDLIPEVQNRLLASELQAELEGAAEEEFETMQEAQQYLSWRADWYAEEALEWECRELAAAAAEEAVSARTHEYEGAAEAACDGLLEALWESECR
mmetsp:Transcript_136581/g.424352  ORF Transcript_136581/g.424352 Transcript_136581/m.424352 type:complete len:270 (+) Transcript_136581:111-920(+)